MEYIGKYRILKRLGGGGFGEVFLAEDEAIHRKVAVKLFKPKDENLIAFATSSTEEGLASLKARFIHEAKILASLDHEDAIINIIEFGELESGEPWYAMPYLPHALSELCGKDVFDKRAVEELNEQDRPKALPLAKALDFIEQILNGLAAAHQKALVHRDIKPANILLTEQGKVRIADFGIAKAPDGQQSTVSHLGMGSRNYMAPEQRESAKHVDARADIYSLGVLAYRLITGKLPTGRYSDPNIHAPALSQALNDVILKAMNEDADLRYQDAAELLAAWQQAKVQTPDTSDYTGTDITDNTASQIKAELKPLQSKITSLIHEQGEVTESDKAVLQALAELADVDEQGLDNLIKQITAAECQKDEQLGAFVQWISKLNQRISQGNSQLSPEQFSAFIETGTQLTGKSEESLNTIITSKGLTSEKASEKTSEKASAKTLQTAQSLQTQEEPESTKASNSGAKKTVATTLLLALIGGGGYYGYSEYQAKLVAEKKVAEEQARQEKLAKQEQARLAKIVEQKAAKRRELDKQAWQLAESTNTQESYQAYLRNWPKGEYQAGAKQALDNLNEQARLAKLAEQEKIDQAKAELLAKQQAQQEDEAAWRKAINQNTLAAYQAYLDGDTLKERKLDIENRVAAIKHENSKIPLTINVTPEDAKIQILDIKEKYQPGIRLVPGSYEVKLSKEGYIGDKQLVNHSAKNNQFSFKLSQVIPPNIAKLEQQMAAIPAGSFLMGSKSSSSYSYKAEPVHRVNIKPFKMLNTEVTWNIYQACIDAGDCKKLSTRGGDNGWGRNERPVTNVNYYDITNRFIPWLNKLTGKKYRLPSEAEWEYAAKAGTITKYSWGDKVSSYYATSAFANCADCGSSWDKNSTAPVKSFEPNEFGLYDMHGNASEWVQDCWRDDYSQRNDYGVAWLENECLRFTVRGGGFKHSGENIGAADREPIAGSDYGKDLGFRLAMDIEPQQSQSQNINNETASAEYLPIVKVAPIYPRRALTRGIEGYVIVDFTVAKDGTIKNPKVVEAQPKGIFDRAALKAVLQFKYKPRVIDGKAVEVPNVQNRFTFNLAKDNG